MKTIAVEFYSKYAGNVCKEINEYASSRGYEIVSVSICELHGSIQAIAVFKRGVND